MGAVKGGNGEIGADKKKKKAKSCSYEHMLTRELMSGYSFL